MNKLGFYIQNSQGTHEQISHVQPPVILIHAWDQGLLEEIRRFRAPEAFVIGRMEYIGQGGDKRAIDQSLINSWLDGADPAARGRELAEHILIDNFGLAQRRDASGRLLVDAWMSLNECVPGPASGAYNHSAAERAEIEARLRAYDSFQAAFRDRLMEQGIEAVAFNFGAGNFTRAAHYLDFFPQTLGSYTYLGFHEYGWPAMRGDPAAGVFSSAGTYRPIVNAIRQQTGRSYKAIITEAGLARMFKHTSDGAGDVGWLYEGDPISQEAYWRSLDWYNDYLVQDDFAVGACLFQVGVGAGWQSFRHSGQDAAGQPIRILEQVRQLQEKTDHQPQPSVGEETPPVAPPVEPPPVPPPPAEPPPGGFQLFLPIVGAPASLPDRVPVPQKVGLDANRPIDPVSGAVAAQVEDPSIIAETGVGWVRINFVLGQAWPSVFEAGWQERYSQIIAGLRNQGLKVYGLISHEALSVPPADQLRNPPPADAAQDPWIDSYVESFAAIARRFHQEVALFESFNEPDDYHDGGENWIHPGWYAVMLQAIHQRVRNDPAIRHITLVSGPVQGIHNDDDHHNDNGGARYLARVYAEGKKRYGWGSRQPFPFDGVGYHLYVGQSPANSEAQILAKYREYLNGFSAVIREAEGQARPIYLSEFGWFSNFNNEEFQARAMRIGMQAALEDPSLALVIWFCCQDFDPEDNYKFYGLYRQGSISPENRKPGVYEGFRKILRRADRVPIALPGRTETGEGVTSPPLQAPIPRIYTNQQAIDAAYNTAKRLGLADQWALLVKAGQDVALLAMERNAIYSGPALDETPGLTAMERSAMRQELLEQLVQTMRWEGLVTATDGLSIRVGPGTEQTRIRFLAHEEKVQVLDDSSDWLFVQTGEGPGYVAGVWVMRQIAPTPVPPAPDGNVAGLLRVWGRFQQLLTEQAERLGIDPAVAVAVLLAESSGDGFAPDGRLLIRFENHIFLDRWGSQNKAVFDRFFAFKQQEPWKEHRWRSREEEGWQNCHQSQAQEWQVLGFARNFIEDPALESISMGASQIMGFNFQMLGYASPRAMFDDFQTGEEAQIRGLFRFIEARGLVEPLRQGDYIAFARGYNGSGQPEYYASLIQKYIELFLREVRGQRGIAARPAAFPVSRGIEPAPALPDGAAWRDYTQAQLQESRALFAETQRILRAAAPSPRFGQLLLGVGIGAAAAAVALAFLTLDAGLLAVGLAVVFGALSAFAFFLYGSIIRQAQAQAASQPYLVWLETIQSSYWARLAGLPAPDGDEIAAISQETTAAIQELLEAWKGMG